MAFSIRFKFILAVTIGMALAAAGVAWMVSAQYQHTVAIAAEQSIRTAAIAYQNLEKQDVAMLSSTLKALQAHPELKAAFKAHDREKLLALAKPIFEPLKTQHRITHFYFLEKNPPGTCFLRVHKPAQFDDVIKRVTYLKAIETNAQASGKELGRSGMFALRVVAPWRDGEELLGYLELGEEPDHFLGNMKSQSGDEYGMLLLKDRLDRQLWGARFTGGARDNWDDHPKTVVADTTNGDEKLIKFEGEIEKLPPTGVVLEDIEQAGRHFVRGAFPVTDAAGQVAGAIFVLHDITALTDSMATARLRALALVVGVAVLLSALLVALLNALIFGRLKKMMDHLEDLSLRVAGGEYDLPAGEVKQGDELSKFEVFLGQFLQLIGKTLKDLQSKGQNKAAG